MNKEDAFEKFRDEIVSITGNGMPRWQMVKNAFFRAWDLALANTTAEPAKPCPFCGSTDGDTDRGESSRWVQCNQCFCRGPLEPTDDEAIEAWNKRT